MYRPLLLALLALAAPLRAQSLAETTFSEATQWTVFVRTSLETPFIEDEQGSWFGSGFLVDREHGWILTNAHVSSHSPASVVVQFQNARPQRAKRVYVDPYLDLAVLQVDPRSLKENTPVARLACDALPPTGHPVGAFGHPWGYRYTGTRGITSAITSRLGPDMIQTDAPINGGNSGGALISLESGAVVGINAAKAVNGEETSEGLGFAVPIVHACRVLELLRAGRNAAPPARLVSFATGEGGERSLTIANMRLPAGAIKLEVGDLIVEVNGVAVQTQGQFTDALRGNLDAAAITVQRAGRRTTLKGSWPAADNVLERSGLLLSGALFAPTPRSWADTLTQPVHLMVHHVEPGSNAEANDLQPYDLLVSVNGRPVGSLADLESLVRGSRDGDLHFVFMRSAEEEDLFEYQLRALPAEAPQLVRNTDR